MDASTGCQERAGDPTPPLPDPDAARAALAERILEADVLETLQRLFDEPTQDARRRLDAVTRRRAFRLIPGDK